MIVLEKNSEHPYREQILDSLMRTLLYSLASQLLSSPDEAMENKYYSAMNELRMSILNTPHKKWTIEAMAELVHISLPICSIFTGSCLVFPAFRM